MTTSIRCGALLCLAVVAQGGNALAEEPRTALKVCADPASPPFSAKDGSGFENRIAELFGKSLGIPVEYTWFPQRIGFIRNTLKDDNTADGKFKCDLVMGVPDNFELAAPTKAYYRSTWVMVYVKGRGLDAIKDPEDITRLPEDVRKTLRIGLFDRSPAAEWLSRRNLIEYMTPYQAMSGAIEDYPGRILEKDLVEDKINLTFVWGPIGGYFAKRAKDVELVVLPMRSEPDAKFDFSIAMGVRHADKAWRAQVNELIDRHRDEIDALLAEYNVPTLPLAAGEPASDDD